MRLYLSKEEAIMLQNLLTQRLMEIMEFPSYMRGEQILKRYMDRANIIANRIEDCLQKQKSGYNRKEKMT